MHFDEQTFFLLPTLSKYTYKYDFVRFFGNKCTRCDNQMIYVGDRRRLMYPGAKIKVSNLIQGFIILGINGSWLSSNLRDNCIINVHKSVPVPF